MRRLSRLLLAAVVVAVLVGVLVPDDGVGSATPEPALWVDRANPACSDAQARVLDPIHPYCTVAAAAAKVLAGDTVRIAAGRYAGTVRPAHGGTPDAPVSFVADAPGVVVDGAGAANTVRLIGRSDVRFREPRDHGRPHPGRLGRGVRPGRARPRPRARERRRGRADQERHGDARHRELARGEWARRPARARRRTLDDGARQRRHRQRPRRARVQRRRPAARRDRGRGRALGHLGQRRLAVRARHLTGASSSGWRLHDNRLAGNSGANIKASGTGSITGNRLIDGRWGLLLSDNPDRVGVVRNVIGGSAQHLVFLTTGTAAARASLVANTIAQRGRSTTTGDASAVLRRGR